MRRIVMFNRVSADGYFAAPDGDLGWVVPEDALDRAAVERMPASDTILFGRRTYDLFEGFWRQARDDSSTAPNPHGERSRAMRAMAVWINAATKVVFSTTRPDATWKNSRLLREFDPRAIDAMKRQRGKDIMVFGSAAIVSQLTQHGLIDEYQFVVTPVLLGAGRPLLSDVTARARLNLVESIAYPSGNVLLRYTRAVG